MQIIVVGTGKLATELLSSLTADSGNWVTSWANRTQGTEKSVVIHAGSGRELSAVADYCAASQSPLIELSTGSDVESVPRPFPVIVCPNTNILMLKVMSMLEKCGHLFRAHGIQLTESHQANKSSVPGTAVNMARSLGLNDSDVRSIRDEDVQRVELQIPETHLGRHAYHQILISDGACSLQLETRVYGESAYADGVSRIVAAVQAHALENRTYSVMEFVEIGWI